MAMTREQAEKLLAEVAAQRLRWGKMYTKKDLPEQALDALVFLATEDSKANADLKAQLTASNRRYAALNARFRKLAKKFGVEVDEEGEGEV